MQADAGKKRLASSWEMSARSLFARQRVESLRWFPRIRLGRPIAKYFGYRPPRLDSVVGRQASRERTTGGTRVNGSIAHGCGQHTELGGLPLAASFLWSSLCGDLSAASGCLIIAQYEV